MKQIIHRIQLSLATDKTNSKPRPSGPGKRSDISFLKLGGLWGSKCQKVFPLKNRKKIAVLGEVKYLIMAGAN